MARRADDRGRRCVSGSIAASPLSPIEIRELPARVTFHDCQYADAGYRAHRGWGHSRVEDTLTFARRCAAENLLLFHHDPGHDDARLEELGADAMARWAQLGGEGEVEIAREGRKIELAP